VSGTMGAAMQGYLHNIPSLAVSMYAYVDIDYRAAARVAGMIAQKVGEGALDGPMLLNVNAPNLSPEQVLGIDVTRISRKNYCDRIEKDYDATGEYFLITRNDELEDALPGTDLWSVENGRVSITPLPDRVVTEQFIARLKSLVPGFEAGLKGAS
jgi:5'-nucleotidase